MNEITRLWIEPILFPTKIKTNFVSLPFLFHIPTNKVSITTHKNILTHSYIEHLILSLDRIWNVCKQTVMDYLTHPCYPKALLLPILIQNNTTKNMKRIIPILSFTIGETKQKKEIREVPWPLVVTLQFDASYFHSMKTLNYSSS